MPPQYGFEDELCFSATVYSSLGFGEVLPIGPMRQVVGVEAVTGLVLIASFTYVQMEGLWGDV